MALGFVHAQDRFFQMDLLRRRGAGELSELFGEVALSADKRYRLHRFRDRAEATKRSLSPEGREFFEAYAKGVNAGLAALEQPPFEYMVLGLAPEEWREVDTLLVLYNMFFELNDETGRRESTLGVLRDVLGQEMFAFLLRPSRGPRSSMFANEGPFLQRPARSRASPRLTAPES